MSSASDVFVTLSASIGDFAAQFGEASSIGMDFGVRMDTVATDVGSVTEAMGVKVEQSAVVTGKAFKQLITDAEAAGAAIKGMGTQVEDGAGKTEKSVSAVSVATARMAAGMQASTTETALSFDRMATDIQAASLKMQIAEDKALAATEAADAKMAAANKKAGDSAAAAGSISAKGYAVAGLAVGALAGIAVDMAAKYQTLTTRLVTSAGETQSNLKMVSDGMLAMASQVGMTADQLATGMYTVESAGYHGAEALNVLKASAQGAKAEGADLKTVADAVSTALNDYHLPASAAATVTSQLITAVGQGKTTMQDFSGALHSITPLASSVGISLADVTGTLAEMTAHGMSADQASQNLAETLRTLQKPSSQATAALAQIGMTVTDLQNSLSTKGLQGTLEQVSQAILKQAGPDGKVLLSAFNTSKQAAQNLTEALKVAPPQLQKLGQSMVDGSMTVKQFSTAVKALPKDQQGLANGFVSLVQQSQGFTNSLKAGGPQVLNYNQMLQAVTGNATTMNTALMVTRENSPAAANNIAKISGATADASGNVKGFAEIQTTLNQKLSDAKAGFGALAIAVGEKLLPAISSIVGVLANVAGWLAKHQTLATILAVGLAALTIGLLAAAAATFIFNAELWANPIVWIVAAVILLGVAVYELIKHWSNVASFFSDIWNAVAGAFMDALSVIGHVLAVIIGIPGDILRGLGQLGAMLGRLATDAWNAFTNGLSIAWQATLHFLANLPAEIGFALGFLAGLLVKLAIEGWQGFQHGIETAYVRTVAWFQSIPGQIVGFFTDVGNWLRTTGIDLLIGLATGIVNGAESVFRWFQALPGRVYSFFTDVGNWLRTTGVNLLIGMATGIYQGAEAVWRWFQNLPSNVWNMLGNAGSWLVGIGQDIVFGLWHGIQSAGSWFMNQINNFTSNIVSGFKSSLGINSPSKVMAEQVGIGIPEGIAKGITDNAHLVKNAAKDVAGSAVSAGQSALTGMTGSMSLTAGLNLGGMQGGVPGAGGAQSGQYQNVTVINVNVAGSAVTEKELAYTMQTVMAQLGQRNSQTYRSYKR